MPRRVTIALRCNSGEPASLLLERWRKIASDFYKEKQKVYSISCIPDIYDMAKYAWPTRAHSRAHAHTHTRAHTHKHIGQRLRIAWPPRLAVLLGALSCPPGGRYDFVHNSQTLPLGTLRSVYEQARSLSNLVVPLEYGFSDAERLQVCSVRKPDFSYPLTPDYSYRLLPIGTVLKARLQ